jgi:hypothetical protein
MLATFDEVVARAKQRPSAKVAIAAAQDRDVLEAVQMAREIGMETHRTKSGTGTSLKSWYPSLRPI